MPKHHYIGKQSRVYERKPKYFETIVTFDEIYNHMGVLYEGHDMEDIGQNVMNYVNKSYDDWDKYIQQGDIVELVQEYASHI